MYWNGTRLPVRNFVDYVDLYLGESSSRKRGGKGKDGDKRKRKKKGSDDESSESNELGTENEGETPQDGDKEDEKPPEKQVVKIHEKMHRWEVVISQTGRSGPRMKHKHQRHRGIGRGSQRGREGQRKQYAKPDDRQRRSDRKKKREWGTYGLMCRADGSGFSQVSFVNSICTPKGGHHVNHVIEPLLAALVKKANAKNKGGMEIKAAHVRSALSTLARKSRIASSSSQAVGDQGVVSRISYWLLPAVVFEELFLYVYGLWYSGSTYGYL